MSALPIRLLQTPSPSPTHQDHALALQIYDHLWASTLEPLFTLTRDYAVKEVKEGIDPNDLAGVGEEGNILRSHLVPMMLEVYEMGLRGQPLSIPDTLPCLPIPARHPTAVPEVK